RGTRPGWFGARRSCSVPVRWAVASHGSGIPRCDGSWGVPSTRWLSGPGTGDPLDRAVPAAPAGPLHAVPTVHHGGPALDRRGTPGSRDLLRRGAALLRPRHAVGRGMVRTGRDRGLPRPAATQRPWRGPAERMGVLPDLPDAGQGTRARDRPAVRDRRHRGGNG